ncbi:thioesterase [Marinicauda salina]|uniref:Thioesterase n=1 Tax=Marinicauda salina TaxID=2135793 RepID=A0A2U2BUZ6_9PROT|nr:thioesterase family protein [Marinicauda salina]PWE17822.1 thioesterase [Marinicauda salina]
METLWRGNANAWECDELGHLNVRAYAAKAWEAIGTLSDRIGMRGAFAANATATLIPRELHVRFLAEARPGAPLEIAGGVADWDDRTLEAVLVMRQPDRDRPTATFRFQLAHADPVYRSVFAWPDRARTALEALRIQPPPEAAPRGLKPAAPAEDVSRARADALGLAEVGIGRFGPADVDIFGRMRPDTPIGKVSDGVVHFATGFPEEWTAHSSDEGLRVAGALLEARVLYRRFATAGEGFVMRSGLTAASEKVRSLVHWVLDPATGEPWWTMEGVACLMDLDERRLRPADPDTLKALKAACIEGLAV